uniref:Uncharacterized protein n=1 Tax=Cyanistes caeruleus TaxID=156563 RepID=A0A8C0Z8W0_CYACU
MTDVEPVVTDFAASGRAGRRNALPDILGSPAGAGTSELNTGPALSGFEKQLRALNCPWLLSLTAMPEHVGRQQILLPAVYSSDNRK